MPAPLSRRQLLRASMGAGALLVTRPAGVLAQNLPSLDHYGTARASRLFPDQQCVHTDLHNHSLFSDGDGEPGEFYGLMRASGIDAAALTDHSTVSQGLPEGPCQVFAPFGAESDCTSVAGIHDGTWEDNKILADEHDDDGDFTAIAGFEWSSPTLGHINVWFSQDYTDPLHTGGIGNPNELLRFAQQEGIPIPNEAFDALAAIVAQSPLSGSGMVGFWDWLKADPGRAALGGGADGLFGFNHPGREPVRFQEFHHDADLVSRCVSMELFNKNEDYLFELTGAGRPSPLVACLDAGWKPGIIGTSDYHGTDWGTPDDRGRAGMYVSSLDRSSIRDAMESRRFFATRIKGLRLDATANGVRMGSTLGHTSGDVTFRLDVDRGPQWYGKRLQVAVMMTGSILPTLVHALEVVVPSPAQPVLEFTVPITVEAGRWIVLRITDPDVPSDNGASGDYAGLGRAIAYSSPFYLDPDAPAGTAPSAAPAAPRPPATSGPLPVTGGGLAAMGALAIGGGLLGLRGRGGNHHHDGVPHAH